MVTVVSRLVWRQPRWQNPQLELRPQHTWIILLMILIWIWSRLHLGIRIDVMIGPHRGNRISHRKVPHREVPHREVPHMRRPERVAMPWHPKSDPRMGVSTQMPRRMGVSI